MGVSGLSRGCWVVQLRCWYVLKKQLGMDGQWGEGGLVITSQDPMDSIGVGPSQKWEYESDLEDIVMVAIVKVA